MVAYRKGKLDEYDEPILPEMAAFCDFDSFGKLPNAGGIRDQEPAIIEGMRFCVFLKRQAEAEEAKARAAKAEN